MFHRLCTALPLLCLLCAANTSFATEPWALLERSRESTSDDRVITQFEEVTWAPNETALIICDMWDLHTSHNATLRTGELAPHINNLAKAVRKQGGTIIHCPSGCMEFYKDHPARAAAKAAPPAANPPEEIGSWCYKIPSEEGVTYPIDQSNGGSDDSPAEKKAWAAHLKSIGRKIVGPWIREHPAIAIQPGDYITDRGNEVWNILKANHIENVMLAGVHANMCVLGRPFGLRRLSAGGFNTVLVRDLTDTMYDPSQWPYVSHFTGTDLIVAYIEQTVCPTITSNQITDGKPFRFKEDDRPRLAIIASEPEYNTAQSLNRFAKRHLGRHFRVSYILRDPQDKNRLVGLEQLKHADIVLLSMRRRALPKEQLAAIRAFLKAGKPIVGIRTASHAFSLHGDPPPEGRATWESFDADIWGGHYHDHHGNGKTTTVSVVPSAKDHPILDHVTFKNWTSPGSLYKVRPLKESATPLLMGKIPEKPAEPIAWTNTTIYDGPAFYTSLGHVEDFKNNSFRRMLFNSLFWALDRPIPEEMPDAKAAAHLDELTQKSQELFTVPDGLVWEPVLTEPRIAQPMYLHFDEQGRLWVMEYLQYPYPAGLTMLSKDKYWRAVYDRVPEPPPHGPKGAGQISIHEDTNGDGRFEKHSIFLDGLSITTSFARGRGGVFVLNPPYLLFYADKDRNDVPDGPPEVLLEGFGLEDTHSVANSLRWGPDGWLYACQGSTVSGAVKKYGSDDPPVATMGQLVWRYHPEKEIYEVFAEGGGNAFGLEIDAAGNIFSGHNGGNTRGFHYIPGGYYRKGFEKHGPLSNPYTYGFYEPMKHPPVERFTHDFIIYEEAALPDKYQGKLFGVEPLQGRITHTAITPRGSTFQTQDISRVVTSKDTSFFRPVNITTGPDGAIYIADFHEKEISHSSHFKGQIMKNTGRVWRLRSAEAGPAAPFNLAERTTAQLVALLDDPRRWYRQTALRLLYDRQDANAEDTLRNAVLKSTETNTKHVVDHLWGLFAVGGLDEKTTLAALNHEKPLVRLWTVRLACDDGSISPAIAQKLFDLAANEPNVRVQVQLACSAREFPTETGLAIIEGLAANELNLQDPFLPLACWWAIEPHCKKSPTKVTEFFTQPAILNSPLGRKVIAERLMRRLAAGSRSHLAECARLLNACQDAQLREKLLAGFEKGLRGRGTISFPPSLLKALAKAGDLPLTLRLRREDDAAIATAIDRITQTKRPAVERIELVRILGQLAIPQAQPALLKLFRTGQSPQLRRAALAALAAWSDPKIAEAMLTALPNREPAEQIAILSILVSRRGWSERFVSELEKGTVDVKIVPSDLAGRILLHGSQTLSNRAIALWPQLAASSSDPPRKPNALRKVITAAAGDPYTGKRLFARNCGRCHTLFSEGGHLGPDLTSDPRSDLSRLIEAVTRPSAEIREGYERYTAATEDGRVIVGLLADKDRHVVILREADGRKVILPRNELDAIVQQKNSLMPERLLKNLSNQQIRDLFAYLRSSQPLNE